MKTGSKGIELIKKYEGFEPEPYLCPAGIPTIGYGATYYENGDSVSLTDCSMTEPEAEQLLMYMLDRYEKGVSRYLARSITNNQFSALVSFAYNLGLGALKGSTLLKVINKDPLNEDIKHQFSRWVKAEGRTLAGLVKRRKEESKLYFQV